MDVNLERLLFDIRRRPNSYGMKGGYREYVAFLNGVNSALGGNLLDGFSVYVAEKSGADWNLYWALVVARVALSPRFIRDLDEIQEHEEGKVVDLLFRELEEFAKRRFGDS